MCYKYLSIHSTNAHSSQPWPEDAKENSRTNCQRERERVERWSRVERLLCEWYRGNPNPMHLLPIFNIYSHIAPSPEHIVSHTARSTITGRFILFSFQWLRIKLCFSCHYFFVYAIEQRTQHNIPLSIGCCMANRLCRDPFQSNAYWINKNNHY